jgi:putative transposase
LNRGNARQEVFHKNADYAAFRQLMIQAAGRMPLRVIGYCLMPNHFHLVLWPYEDGDLSRFMQWLLTSHVRRYHRHYGGSGHVWQGRFKAFPIEEDEHLLTVLRYVERNALRARLVRRAENWRWSSLTESDEWLHPGPVGRGEGWAQLVNEPQTEAEVQALRRSVNRGTPFGSQDWQQQAAKDLGLETTLRPRGRPRKSEK